MNIEDLKKDLIEKEEMKQRSEIVFHQLNGQIALLKDLIRKEENSKREENK